VAPGQIAEIAGIQSEECRGECRIFIGYLGTAITKEERFGNQKKITKDPRYIEGGRDRDREEREGWESGMSVDRKTQWSPTQESLGLFLILAFWVGKLCFLVYFMICIKSEVD
jgi:hypothetical protein